MRVHRTSFSVLSVLSRLFVPALVLAFALEASASVSPPSPKRLVSFGVGRAAGIPDEVKRALDDTFATQLARAASERGFTLVPLARVRGLEEQAASCRAAGCRRAILARLGASHSVRGVVFAEGRGYVLALFLSSDEPDDLLAAKRLSGDVPELMGSLSVAVDALLEEVVPARFEAMEKLAKTARSLREKGRGDDAVRTLERAIAISPFHPAGARLQLEKLALIEGLGDDERTLAAILAVVDEYGPRSAWTMAGIGDEAQRAAFHDALRARLAGLATRSHTSGYGARAERAYVAYLEHFQSAPDVAELALYLAELELARGALADAALHYAFVREHERASDEHRRAAALGALYALEKELAAAMERGEVTKLDYGAALVPPLSPVELAPAERALIGAVDRLLMLFPDAERADAFAYRAAQICVLRGDVDEGKGRLARVIERWPRSQAGARAREALFGLAR